MELVDNKILNILFKVAIALGLAGIIMFLIQEIVTAMQGTAYTVLVVIADFIGIFALIALIVWLFIPVQKTLVLNLTYLLGAVYVFLFSFAHFFTTLYWENNIAPFGTANILNNFITTGVSFIGLILLVLVTIGIIVLFSLKFTKREEIPVYEKFAVLIWILLIAIYDFGTYYYVRQNITFDKFLLTTVGITFLPRIIEFIFLLFAAILLIFKLFSKTDNKVMTALTLVLVNMIFFTLAITTVTPSSFSILTAMGPAP